MMTNEERLSHLYRTPLEARHLPLQRRELFSIMILQTLLRDYFQEPKSDLSIEDIVETSVDFAQMLLQELAARDSYGKKEDYL